MKAKKGRSRHSCHRAGGAEWRCGGELTKAGHRKYAKKIKESGRASIASGLAIEMRREHYRTSKRLIRNRAQLLHFLRKSQLRSTKLLAKTREHQKQPADRRRHLRNHDGSEHLRIVSGFPAHSGNSKFVIIGGWWYDRERALDGFRAYLAAKVTREITS